MDPQYAYQSAPMNMPPILMAEGGLAAAAQQVQNKGRGGDSMLVHMSPGEVKGLQALALSQGGSLTINPTTGLPEARILQALLPMIAGFALGPAGFGLFSSALTTGLGVGALTGLATGSLKKGLMAGLGAYGGAGLGQGLVSAATPAEAAASQVTAAPTSAFEMAQSNLGPAAEFATKESVLQNAIQSPAYQNALASPQLAGSPALDAMNAADVAQAKVLPGQTIVTTPAAAPTGLDALKSGAKNIFATGQEGTAARAAFGKALPFGTVPATAIPLASAAAEPPKGPGVTDTYLRPYKFEWNPQEGAYTPSPTPGDTSERRYVMPTFTPLPIQRAAQGGEINNPMDEMSQDGGYAKGGEAGLAALAKKRRSLMGDKPYRFADDRRDSSMEAAIEQNFAGGGALPPRFLSGGGDGMSDSIPANIDGKQEARLADGEFVVPADVVSHLGNGSSKAGAKKLYAMMDKIRKARTGKTRQAPEVNAAKYMPA